MNFLLLKYIHIVAVASSFALLFIRGIWLLRAYPPAQESWVRVLPHAVDGVLLVSALGMLWVYPAAFKGDWLLGVNGAISLLVGGIARIALETLHRFA